jgi:hypothetical protein
MCSILSKLCCCLFAPPVSKEELVSLLGEQEKQLNDEYDIINSEDI